MVHISNSEPVYSFQLTIDGIGFTDVEFYEGPWFWWLTSFNFDNGLVTGQTSESSPIPPGEYDLLSISFSEGADCGVCLLNFYYQISPSVYCEQEVAVCSYFDFPPQLSWGDWNGSGQVDVLDVLSLVNLILQEDSPSVYDLYIVDLNHDELLDVLDILLLVNLIIHAF